MQKKQKGLSKKTRGIFYNIKKQIKEYQIDLKQLAIDIFGTQKSKLKHTEFQNLIKQIDYLLNYEDVDFVWNQLNSRGKGYVRWEKILYILEGIKEEDNPFHNQLDQKSQDIIISMKTIPVLTEDNKITLALKDYKDVLKNLDPWEIMDIFDEDRDGKLTRQDLLSILVNLGVDQFSHPLIIKGIFGQSQKQTFEDIMKKLGLENIRKRIDFNDIPEKDHFLKNSLNMSKAFNKKKPAQKQKQKKQEVVIQNIPHVIRPYYTGLTQMTQPFLSLARAKLQSNQVFIDKQNPESKYKKWEHITKIFKKDYFLFQQAQSIIQRSQIRTGLGELVNANQINQGEVGNCYFMSAVASTAQSYPEMIYRLFVLDKNPSSIYGIRLFIDGKWETVVLDARFPVDEYGRLVYAKPKSQQIWSLLLEKAWAKLYKSYQNISSGASSQGLTAITGAPCITLSKDQPDIMGKIKQALNKKYIINISGSKYLDKQTDDWQKRAGLYAGHAYSVINLHLNLDWNGDKISLIKLRNPWGNKAWNGNFSFTSKKWTPQLRKKLNYHKDPNDGSFYMDVNDFTTCFDQPAICYITNSNVNSTITLTTHRQHSTMVQFTIKTKGNYFISMYQQSKRKYKASGNYQLSKSRLFLAKIEQNNSVIPVISKACFKQNLHIEEILEPGTYQISCKIKWKYKQSNSFNLTSYGPQPLTFKSIPKDKQFIPKFIQYKAKHHSVKQQKKYYSGPLQKSYKIVKTSHEEGYGYIIVKNKSQIKFTSQLEFKKGDEKIQTGIGIKPFKPDTLQYKISLEPGQQIIKCLLVDPQGINYIMSESVAYIQTVRR